MLSLRVVKGAVNFIVLLLGFGVDADSWAFLGFSSPRDIQVSEQMQATKVRRFLAGGASAPGGEPARESSSARGHGLEHCHLSVSHLRKVTEVSISL